MRRVKAKRDARSVLPALLAMAFLLAAWTSVAHAAPALNFTTFSAGALNADESPSVQAGAHPFELENSFTFGTVFDTRVGYEVPAGAIKDTVIELPPGALGDPGATPQCSQNDMNGDPGSAGACPADAQIGYADLELQFFGPRKTVRVPGFNMVPPPDEPAQFAFLIVAAVSHIDVQIRNDADGTYTPTATVHNINTAVPVYSVAVHLWGVPADPSHDAVRGGPSGLARKPFLRNPTSCAGPTATTIHATSWQEPNEIVSDISTAPETTGCSEVPFSPTVSVKPDTRQAGSPAGYDIDVHLPQSENPDALATSDLKSVAMRLPTGVAINPGAASGLAGCSDSEFAISSSAEDECPNSARIGDVQVETPLLSKPLEGSLFLGSPLEQGAAAAAAGRMYRLFLEVEGSGVRVKLAGSVVPDPLTGQLTATFNDNPQLPFETLHIELTGGARAPLTTPQACGAYTTHAEFTPWARPTEAVSSDSNFTIDENCANAASFTPSIDAGTSNPIAGAFSPFKLRLIGQDGQQNLARIETTLPQGLLAKLTGVTLCGEAEAASGECPAASQIGTTTVGAGAGASPLYVPQPGRAATAVYLGGPYRSAPYSILVKVPAQAGPFDLGTVTVRNALYIDPHTAQVTVKSDPLPQILDGVPITYRDIRVEVNRPGFTLNPTSCTPMQVTSTLTSAAGSSANPSDRFQAAGCGSLPFKPVLTASTSGKTSKANGALLRVKVVQKPGAANIRRVKVALPKALPSRLATLNKACTEQVFAANPAACPAASRVGTASARTPILPDPLVGPAYFVSHGGAKFPELVVVLQGDGVTIDLAGETFISKAGVTSSTFATVPDAPVSSFELSLPMGRYSALAANGNLCHQKLKMPTELVGQNGALLKKTTSIKVEGCPRARPKAHRKH